MVGKGFFVADVWRFKGEYEEVAGNFLGRS